jgi:DNA-binding MurR/RpiR family transcriptional regulator
MFREQIRKHYDHLSRSYRRVADYILSDYRSAAFMTAAELAHTVQVDTTTVVRFAQRLGYPGYPELIEDVQGQVKLELNQTYETPVEEDGVAGKIRAQVAADRSNLEKALTQNSLDALENMVDKLRVAPRIVVIGESYAAPLAESFAGALREAGLPSTYVSGDVYERAAALSHLVRKEVVIGMTPVEGPSGVSRALKYARAGGAITVACTTSLNSQAARSSEHLLYAPGESEGAPPSLTSLFALCNSIAHTLAQLQPQTATKRSAEIAKALSELS